MQRVQLLEWNAYGKITSMAALDNSIYVGTSDGNINMYNVIPEKSATSATFTYSYQTKKMKSVGKKSVTQIEIDQKKSILFALVDNVLCMFDLVSLDLIFTIKATKGCSSFSLNKCREAPYDNQLIAIMKRKTVFIEYFEEDAQVVKDYSLPDNIMNIEWYKNHVCIGLKHQQVIIDADSGKRDSSGSLENLNLSNIVVDSNIEYLPLSNTFGLYDPVFTKFNPIAISICFPFIVCIGATSIAIFNLYQKEVVSTMSISKGIGICSTPKRVYVIDKLRIWALTPLSIDEQITNMIHKSKISQAFSMFEKTYTGSKDNKLKRIYWMKEEAAFTCLFATRFREAFRFFFESQVDPRDILLHFEGLLPPNLNHQPKQVRGDFVACIRQTVEKRYTSASGRLSASKEVLEKHHFAMYKNAKKNLLSYLERIRTVQFNTALANANETEKHQRAIDYALAYLYLNEKQDFDKLRSLYRFGNNANLKTHKELLSKNKSFFALLLWSKGYHEEAMETLCQVGYGKLEESSNALVVVDEMVELLVESKDRELIFKYLDSLFEINETKAVNLFCNPGISEFISIDETLAYLTIYPSDVKITFYEYLIEDLKSTNVDIHNQLVLFYIDACTKLKPQGYIPHGVRVEAGKELGLLGSFRTRLLTMLSKKPSYYSKHKISNRLKGTSLFEEMVVIFRVMDQHEKSLSLLLFELRDYSWAERYCEEVYNERKRQLLDERHALEVKNSTQNVGKLQRIQHEIDQMTYNHFWLDLLRLCFHRTPTNEPFGIDILNRHAAEIHPIDALTIIPDHLNLKDMNHFLNRQLRHAYDRLQQVQYSNSLNNLKLIRVSSEKACSISRRRTITDSTLCGVCNMPIGSSAVFVVFPDQSVFHAKCANKESPHHIHPTHHRDFRLVPENIAKQFSIKDVLEPKINQNL